MGRKVKKEITMAVPKFAIRYFWNRQQYVFAKNNKTKRYSFFPIDEIYKEKDYKIMQLSEKVAVKSLKTLEKRCDELIGYEADFEKVDTKFLVQDGYIK